MEKGFRGFICSSPQRFQGYMKNLRQEIRNGSVIKGFDYSEINSFCLFLKFLPSRICAVGALLNFCMNVLYESCLKWQSNALF
jgi:hypothetical protein